MAHCFLDTYFVINISTTPKLSKFFYKNILFCIVLHCDENGKHNNLTSIFSVFSLGYEERKSNSNEQRVYAEHRNVCVCIYVCIYTYKNARAHARTHTRTCARTHTHTHAHKNIYQCIKSWCF